MPELPLPAAFTSVKKFYMPSTSALPKDQQGWIMMDVGYNTVSDMAAVEQDDKNLGIASWRILAHRIKDWNFTMNNQKAAITVDNVIRLADEDKEYIRKIPFETGEAKPLSEEKKSS